MKRYIRILAICLFASWLCCVHNSLSAQEKRSVGEILATTEIKTLKFKNADLDTVLSLLSEQYALNIIAGEAIEGLVTINLEDVSLKGALETILSTNGFGYTLEGNIIKISPINVIAQDLKAKKEIEDYEMLITEVINLKYLDAKDVSGVLSNMLSKRGKISILERKTLPGWKISGLSSGSSDSESVFDTERMSTTNERSSTIIISDIPSRVAKIRQIITKIDCMSKQIIIDAIIVEINSVYEKNLGIRWDSLKEFGLTAGPLDTKTPLLKLTNEHVRKVDDLDKGEMDLNDSYAYDRMIEDITKDNFSEDFTGNIDQSLSNAKTLSDVRTAVLSSDQFKVVLSALKSMDDAELISNPTIMTIDNHEATILVGEKYPIFRTDVSDQGTVTESFDRFEPVGIILRVIPQVSAGDKINMLIHPTVSKIGEVVTGTTGLTYPRIKIREADTQVLINKNDTVVIGGLVVTEEREVNTKVPFLGDIPFIGNVFKHKKTVKDKANLLVFVTPTLIDNAELTKDEQIIHDHLLKQRALKAYLQKIQTPEKENPRKKRRKRSKKEKTE